MRARIARRKAYNLIFVTGCFVATAIAVGFLGLILWSLIDKGLPGVNLHLFAADTMSTGSNGGLRNAFVGSGLMLAVAMAISVVVGVLAGTWLSEYSRNSIYGHIVRFLNDVLLSAPSILIGLAVYGLMVATHVPGYSGLAGSVALAMIATPVVTRTTEDILALQSTALREAGSALGTPQWLVVRRIVWRAAGGGLLTGTLLAFARISGETAPLLFTSFGNNFFSANMLRPIASVTQFIYNDALSSFDDLVQTAWAGALVVAMVVLVVNVLGRVIAQRSYRS